MQLTMTFGEAEALVAAVNGIANDRRATFQSRIKNLLKLGLLRGLRQGRGKTAAYDSASIATLALAVEMTQLDLSPERLVRMLGGESLSGVGFGVAVIMVPALESILADNWRSAIKDGTWPALSCYLVFDPHALLGLTNEVGDHTLTMLQGNASNHARRSSQINVSLLLHELVEALGLAKGQAFIDGLVEWHDR